jgi:hypothetical protein
MTDAKEKIGKKAGTIYHSDVPENAPSIPHPAIKLTWPHEDTESTDQRKRI